MIVILHHSFSLVLHNAFQFQCKRISIMATLPDLLWHYFMSPFLLTLNLLKYIFYFQFLKKYTLQITKKKIDVTTYNQSNLFFLIPYRTMPLFILRGS